VDYKDTARFLQAVNRLSEVNDKEAANRKAFLARYEQLVARAEAPTAWRPLTKESHPAQGQLVALWSPTGYHEILEWDKKLLHANLTHWHPETRPAPPSTRIDDQDVSVRFTILCERSGIVTVQDLAQRGEASLRSAGFTAKMIKEARALLAQHKHVGEAP